RGQPGPAAPPPRRVLGAVGAPPLGHGPNSAGTTAEDDALAERF
ncbi:hypothetical protein ABIC07_007797, partial [Bradyrhizobium sp. RT9a]